MPAGSRVAALCAATLVTGALTFGGGVALAADAPAPGTAECRDAVNLNADVKAQRVKVQTALDALNKANQGGDPATIANAQQDVADAKSLLAVQVANVTNRVCTGTVTTTPPVTTTPAPVNNGDRTFAEAGRLIANLECDDDFVSDQARIASLRTAAGNGLSQAQQNRLTDLLNDRLDALRDCEPADEQPTTVTVPPATSTPPSVVGGAQVDNNVTVNPTQDDGSVADTDGSQIEVTPEGSASTGAA